MNQSHFMHRVTGVFGPTSTVHAEWKSRKEVTDFLKSVTKRGGPIIANPAQLCCIIRCGQLHTTHDMGGWNNGKKRKDRCSEMVTQIKSNLIFINIFFSSRFIKHTIFVVLILVSIICLSVLHLL